MSEAANQRERHPSALEAEGPTRGRSFFLVIDGPRTSVFFPPPEGEVLVGSGPAAALRLDQPQVPELQAKIRSSGGAVSVDDLGSLVPVRVNGERIRAERILSEGDVVSLGPVTLVLRRDLEPPARRPALDPGLFRVRLDEEIERWRRYDRPLSVGCLVLGKAAQPLAERVLAKLRLLDAVACDGPGQLLLLLPEARAEHAAIPLRRALQAILEEAPEARAGFAVCPRDGSDARSLLQRARTAAHRGATGEVVPASEAVAPVALGDAELVASSPAMVRLVSLVERLGPTDLPVLICGEIGTGKELIARALHQWSKRAQGELVTASCAGLSASVAGSQQDPVPRLNELAARAVGGTLFLDEVDELPPSAQAWLLQLLGPEPAARSGSREAAGVRVVAAPQRDLSREVEAGRFRSDLYFRLGAASVIVPPLVERLDDLPRLARALLHKACGRIGRKPMELSPAAENALKAYAWPGNVRELRNAMEYAAAVADGPEVEPGSLPQSIARKLEVPTQPAQFRNIHDELQELERSRMQAALAAAKGVQTRAAELIGMPLRTFVAKRKQYGLDKA